MTPAQIFLINSWRPRAIALASRMAPSLGLDVEDTVGEALYALTVAAKNWPGYCARNDVDFHDTAVFGYYTNRCVAGRISEVLRSSGPLSRRHYQIFSTVKDAYFKGTASHAKMAEMAGATVPEVSKVMAVMTEQEVPLEGNEYDNGAWYEDDMCEGDCATDLLESLDDISRKVVEYRVLDSMSFRDIGAELNISSKRASDIYSTSIAKLQDVMKESTNG